VADGSEGLRIINVSNRSTPTEIGYYNTGVSARHVYVVDNYVYVADGSDGIYIFEITQFILTISAGTGGTTDPVPGTYAYDVGTEVPITALPENGYRFSGWTESVPSGHENDNPITITMDSDKSITANFTAIPPPKEEAGKKGGCFIATAAYGSPLHPHLDILRDFRDIYLMPSKLGRALVNIYYKYSPSVADFIAKHSALKVAVWISLLPLVAFSYSMVHLGLIITVVIPVFIFAFPIFLTSFFRRKLRRVEAKDPKALASLY